MREKEKAREGGKAGKIQEGEFFYAIIKLINLFHLYIIK